LLAHCSLTDQRPFVADPALRLLAEGLDTAEVSGQLFYSERTVKNIIHDITSRLELRNRTHAVAYPIKAGLI
jgi:DNA-binding NarL/FixJ family response regulator